MRTVNKMSNDRLAPGVISVWCHIMRWIIIGFGSAYIGLICGKYIGNALDEQQMHLNYEVAY